MASNTPVTKDIIEYSPVPTETEGDQTFSFSVESSSKNPDAVNKKDVPIRDTTREEALVLWTMITLLILIFLGYHLYLFLGFSQEEDHAAPILVLNSLFVSNFSVGTGGLIATWDAKFTLKNNSTFSKLRYSNIGVTITYKNNPLSKDGSEFSLDEGQSTMLRMRFVNRGTAGWKYGEPFLENEMLDEMSKEVENFGSLNLGMKMKMYAYYFDQRKWVPLFDKDDQEIVTAQCDNMKIKFLPHNKDLGKLVNLDMSFSAPVLERTYGMLY